MWEERGKMGAMGGFGAGRAMLLQPLLTVDSRARDVTGRPLRSVLVREHGDSNQEITVEAERGSEYQVTLAGRTNRRGGERGLSGPNGQDGVTIRYSWELLKEERGGEVKSSSSNVHLRITSNMVLQGSPERQGLDCPIKLTTIRGTDRGWTSTSPEP